MGESGEQEGVKHLSSCDYAFQHRNPSRMPQPDIAILRPVNVDFSRARVRVRINENIKTSTPQAQQEFLPVAKKYRRANPGGGALRQIAPHLIGH